MKSFEKWASKHLFIQKHPALNQMKDSWWLDYDIVLNVSDLLDFELDQKLTAEGRQTFWFPLGESYGMPLENIYGAIHVLWQAEKRNSKVLLHCKAGQNRSVCVADCYYFLRTGEHREDLQQSFTTYGKNKYNQLIQNINDNQLPGIFRMGRFLESCRESLEKPSSTIIDWLKKESIYIEG